MKKLMEIMCIVLLSFFALHDTIESKAPNEQDIKLPEGLPKDLAQMVKLRDKIYSIIEKENDPSFRHLIKSSIIINMQNLPASYNIQTMQLLLEELNMLQSQVNKAKLSSKIKFELLKSIWTLKALAGNKLEEMKK